MFFWFFLQAEAVKGLIFSCGSLVLTDDFMMADDVSEEESDVSKAQEHLLHSFRSGTSACLICIDNIKREDAVSIFCNLHCL